MRSEKSYEYQRNYAKEYNKKNYKTITLRFNVNKDADIIEYVESLDQLGISKNEYFLNLIRENMKK